MVCARASVFVAACFGLPLLVASSCSPPPGPRLQIAQAAERTIPGLPFGDGLGVSGYVSMPSPENRTITLNKRFVLRHPHRIAAWSGTLVVGAHGGRGGKRYDASGADIGSDETALDDIVGRFALEQGHAYASLDRSGHGGTRDGDALVESFTRLMSAQIFRRLRREPDRILLVGFSMGGGIARFAAERESVYDGVLAIAGAGGDVPGQILRRIAMADAWQSLATPSDAAPEGAAKHYAEIVGTPIEARRFWPFMGRSASLQSIRDQLVKSGYPELEDHALVALTPATLEADAEAFDSLRRDDTLGIPVVPFVEVVGTFDDFVLSEVLAYRAKVERQEFAEQHRLYRVEGAWHLDRNDDAVGSFQFIGSRMGLSQEAVEAMGSGASYISVVQDAVIALERWVVEGEPPPASRILEEGESL